MAITPFAIRAVAAAKLVIHGDDPKAIMEAAEDPEIPEEIVIAAAEARSRTGKLLRNVKIAIAKRRGSLEQLSDLLPK